MLISYLSTITSPSASVTRVWARHLHRHRSSAQQKALGGSGAGARGCQGRRQETASGAPARSSRGPRAQGLPRTPGVPRAPAGPGRVVARLLAVRLGTAWRMKDLILYIVQVR